MARCPRVESTPLSSLPFATNCSVVDGAELHFESSRFLETLVASTDVADLVLLDANDDDEVEEALRTGTLKAVTNASSRS